MKISKDIKIGTCIGICLFLLQLLPIWWLYPKSDDFGPVKTITGIYRYDGGGSSSLSQVTKIDNEQIHCTVSFWGPISSCPMKFQNKIVTVTIVSYKYIFGTGQVVSKITTTNDEDMILSVNQLIDRWLSASIRDAAFMAFVVAIILNCIRKIWLLKWGNKNG